MDESVGKEESLEVTSGLCLAYSPAKPSSSDPVREVRDKEHDLNTISCPQVSVEVSGEDNIQDLMEQLRKL